MRYEIILNKKQDELVPEMMDLALDDVELREDINLLAPSRIAMIRPIDQYLSPDQTSLLTFNNQRI